MTPAVELAVDFANYAGRISSETVDAWKAAGVKLAIVRASTESAEHIAITRWQLQTCQGCRLYTDAYAWLYFDDSSAPSQMMKAASVVDDYPVVYMWLDCEEPSPWGPEQTVAYIAEAATALEELGYEVGVYTSRGFWLKYTDNSMALRHLSLWDSDPDGVPGLDFVPYGGWEKAAIRQYAFDVELGGVNVDLNSVSAEVLYRE